MRELFRCLGIKFSLKGTQTLEKLVNGQKQMSDLSDKEINEILEAWDGRRYVPIHNVDRAINSKPEHIEGETEIEYNHRHVAKIVNMLKSLMSSPCA